MKLDYKIEIKGTLELKTGLHIGGSETTLDIGGIDNAVIKDSKTNKAYIPGSSLKGKLRDLIARAHGIKEIRKDTGNILTLFGKGSDRKSNRNFGHLIIRDAFIIDDNSLEELEEKAENVINRVTGHATPRHIERVVRGNQFRLDMILDIYKSDDHLELLKTLRLGFRLLENDYLGGSGTRGYGKVSIEMDKPKKIIFDKRQGTIDDKQYIDFDFNERTNETSM